MTYKITLNESEFAEYTKMLKEKGFKQIGTNLYEDGNRKGFYVRIKIEK